MPQAENVISMDRYRRAPGNQVRLTQSSTLAEIRAHLAKRVRPCPHHDGTLVGACAVQEWLIETMGIYNEVLA
jgi:hypothetical protein